LDQEEEEEEEEEEEGWLIGPIDSEEKRKDV